MTDAAELFLIYGIDGTVCERRYYSNATHLENMQ